MACHFVENVYTQIFTPREYQVELLEAAKERNTIVCSSTSSTKTFIAVKLLQEFAWQMRACNGKRALFILDAQNIGVMTSHIKLLTDLNVISLVESIVDIELWTEIITQHSVIITTIDICTEVIQNKHLDLKILNLIVIDDCLYGERQILLNALMNDYCKLSKNRPRILGLAGSLLGPELQPECLEDELQRLEKLLCGSVNTSSELVTLLRFCCRPQEHLVECSKMIVTELQTQLESIVFEALEFVEDHRFDPSEIYDDEFYLEELEKVPNPKDRPKQLLLDFMEILKDLGPWAADQAALSLLALIEKLKVKVPYERHYLLLCMISTVMVKIRAICDNEFQELSDVDRILQYSSPKILRFLEIIKQFKPAGERPKEATVPSEAAVSPNTNNNTRNQRGKSVRGGRRSHIQRPQQDDSLCALVFVRNRITAKVVFTLLYIMTQKDDDFWWLSALYSVEKVADPIKEPREAEAEHLRQEEVLRKYRTHDCNVMVATSILEQGCDLPKCNLVVRFDIPNTFHSYVQSKARARAVDAHYLLLVTENEMTPFVELLAEYIEVEKTLLRRCYGSEPNEQDEIEADRYSESFPVYKPLTDFDAPLVSYSTSITLVNRYCAKLPSDTFTRLTPLWEVTKVKDNYY